MQATMPCPFTGLTRSCFRELSGLTGGHKTNQRENLKPEACSLKPLVKSET